MISRRFLWALAAAVALGTQVRADEEKLPRLLDLGATSCIPCKKMAPILEEMKKEYAGVLDVVFIDVWKNPAQGKKYGIQQIPTQIFFDANDKELFRHVGFFSKKDMLAKWRDLGYDFTPTPPQATPDERSGATEAASPAHDAPASEDE